MSSTMSKTTGQERASTYKSRTTVGSSHRFLRVHQASVDRKASRMDNLNKRRRMPLSPITDDNQLLGETKGSTSKAGEGNIPGAPSRRDKLLKWKEQQMLKKKAQQAEKANRKSFVVRQVTYKPAPFFTTDKTTNKNAKKPTALMDPGKFEAKPEKRVTRSSARQAKAGATAQDKTKNLNKNNGGKGSADRGSTATKTGRTKVPEKKEVSKNKTRSTVSKPNPTASKTDPTQSTQIKTRSQMKKDRLQESSGGGTEAQKPKTQDEEMEDLEMPSFPQLDTIMGSVTIGRGSTEGAKRGGSFAPNNFHFTAPSGVGSFFNTSKTFKFQPMSPGSAERFMFPSSSGFFNPKHTSSVAEPTLGENGFIDDKACEVFLESDPQAQQQDRGEGADASVAMGEKYDVATKEEGRSEREAKPDDMDTAEEKNDERNATYFRNLVSLETQQLNKACKQWEQIQTEEQELTEEVIGQIRTVIGQAQLLIAQRFKQFSGLIDLSEDKTAEKQATASDLQGFWEMIYFQVEDVNAKFEALSKLQQNGWKEEAQMGANRKRKAKPKKPKVSAASKENVRPSGTRSKIQEMRARMKTQKNRMENGDVNMNGKAFVTILTPVKRRTKLDCNGEIILTPVRRSLRNTPLLCNGQVNSPAVVTAPARTSKNSPGLKLTPEVTAQGKETVGISSESSGGEMAPNTISDESQSANKPRRSGRKSSSRVTFQPNAPEPSMLSPAVTRGTPRSASRRLSRRCRSRVPTPYFSDREKSRARVGGATEERTSDSTTESDVGEPKSPEEQPLRRSARRTPKLAKGASSLDEKYLRPSTSEEDDPETSADEQGACSVFKAPTSGLRLKGTPMSILKHINDLETPSPNSRQITPMPKTTLFISPPEAGNGAKTAPLLPLTPVVGGTAAAAPLTLCSGLADLSLKGTELNKKRDSVFFAQPNESFESTQENLMCFSPVVSTDE